jgi:hypothetical protein
MYVGENRIAQWVATGCGTDGRGLIPGKSNRFFSSPQLPDLLLRPTQPPIQWTVGALSLAVKCPGLEVDHSLPYFAEVKNGTAIPSLPHTCSWRAA